LAPSAKSKAKQKKKALTEAVFSKSNLPDCALAEM